MIPDAARMRRWMLLGAPFIFLAALGMHAGGGAAGIYLWAAIGVIRLPRGRYPYSRRRGGRPGRLFFALALGGMLASLPVMLFPLLWPGFFNRGLLYPFLMQMGSITLALSLSAPIAAANIPEQMGWSLGLMCLMLSLVFIFYRQ